jgi:hypothetical protein
MGCGPYAPIRAQAETPLAGAGCLTMMDRLLATASLVAVALIVAAPLWP